jgi:hypothetical protein
VFLDRRFCTQDQNSWANTPFAPACIIYEGLREKRRLGACGESQVLKGHDFSRAASGSKLTWASAPEGRIFGIFDFSRRLLAACGKTQVLKGHDFSRAVNGSK